jgi:hypothetical protein
VCVAPAGRHIARPVRAKINAMQILFMVLLFFDFREANGFDRGA